MFNSLLNYLSFERCFSNHTIINYKNDLMDYYNYVGKIDVSIKDIRSYQRYLSLKKYSNATVARRISSLRSFYGYLKRNNIIKSNPMVLIGNPKKEKKLPNFLNYNDVEKLLSMPNLDTSLGQRDALVMEMLYSTGVRVSELVNIKLSDINYTDGSILVMGKGSKERYVYFGSRCRKLIDKYVNNGRRELVNSVYLFSNKHGNKLNDRVVRMIISKYERLAGLKMHVTPHTLRHTYATHMLNEGADLKSVGDLLGHENLSTTQIYTHVSNERLRNVYLNSHPRAKL